MSDVLPRSLFLFPSGRCWMSSYPKKKRKCGRVYGCWECGVLPSSVLWLQKPEFLGLCPCRKEGQRATHSTWETRLMVCDVRRDFCRSLCNFRHLGLILCSLVQNSKLENFLYLCSMGRSLRFSQAPVWRWSSFSFGCGACLSSLLNPVSINVDSWIWARVRCDAWWVMRTFWVWTLLWHRAQAWFIHCFFNQSRTGAWRLSFNCSIPKTVQKAGTWARLSRRRNRWYDHHVCAMDCVPCLLEFALPIGSSCCLAVACLFWPGLFRYSSQNRQGPPSETVTVLLLAKALHTSIQVSNSLHHSTLFLEQAMLGHGRSLFLVFLRLMLMPNAAFCTGLQTLAKFEAARVGVQWDNVFMEVFRLNHSCCLRTWFEWPKRPRVFKGFPLWATRVDSQGEKFLLHICTGHDVPGHRSVLCLNLEQTLRNVSSCFVSKTAIENSFGTFSKCSGLQRWVGTSIGCCPKSMACAYLQPSCFDGHFGSPFGGSLINQSTWEICEFGTDPEYRPSVKLAAHHGSSWPQLASPAVNADAAAAAEEAALEGPSAKCAAAEEIPQAEVSGWVASAENLFLSLLHVFFSFCSPEFVDSMLPLLPQLPQSVTSTLEGRAAEVCSFWMRRANYWPWTRISDTRRKEGRAAQVIQW